MSVCLTAVFWPLRKERTVEHLETGLLQLLPGSQVTCTNICFSCRSVLMGCLSFIAYWNPKAEHLTVTVRFSDRLAPRNVSSGNFLCEYQTRCFPHLVRPQSCRRPFCHTGALHPQKGCVTQFALPCSCLPAYLCVLRCCWPIAQGPRESLSKPRRPPQPTSQHMLSSCPWIPLSIHLLFL